MSANQKRRIPFAILLLAIMAAMGLLVILDRSAPGGPLPTPTPLPPPQHRTPSPIVAQLNQRRSVVLISMGSVSGATLAEWMADGTMPTLAHLSQQGRVTTTFRSVDPPLPGPALTALATGSDAPGVEPIWESAALEQRITALLFWPDVDLARDGTDVGFALSCAAPDAPATQQTVALSTATPWPGAPTSFSPPFEGNVSLPSPHGPVDWRILALDTQDDGARIYDTFLLASIDDGDPAAGPDTPQLHPDAWGRLPVFGRSAPPLMLKVTDQRTTTRTLSLSPSIGLTSTAALSPTMTLTPTKATTSSLELILYQIAAQEVMARPMALGRAAIERFGFCPPLPDPSTVAQGQISAEAFAELTAARAHWAGRVAAYVYETVHPHLLLVRQEALLAAEQALLLQDPRQPGYSRTRAAEFAALRRAVATAADGGLDDLLAAVDFNYATILVISEQGTAPVHTQVNVAAIRQSVHRLLNEMDRRGIYSAEAALTLRAEGGVLSVEIETETANRGTVQEVVIDTLAALADPHTGELIFARVARIEQAADWAKAWPKPSDVIAQAKPGYALMVAEEEIQTFSEPQFYGQGGYDADLPAMQGAFIVAGWGIWEAEVIPGPDLLEIAPAVMQWLVLSAGP